ncbi:hypothetical protein Taro_016899 [Colocasia esculenta]|uniref:Uncharacterized protein n=1 Tax=Colocasia esculenta TaxID=4460 RepID=A0A843UM18_COLES|nr:hypothetical protein [Colocasia esculenta]
MNTKNSSSQPQTLPQIYTDHREREERRRSLKLEVYEVCKHKRKCLDKRVFLSKRFIPLCFMLSPRSGRSRSQPLGTNPSAVLLDLNP